MLSEFRLRSSNSEVQVSPVIQNESLPGGRPGPVQPEVSARDSYQAFRATVTTVTDRGPAGGVSLQARPGIMIVPATQASARAPARVVQVQSSSLAHLHCPAVRETLNVSSLATRCSSVGGAVAGPDDESRVSDKYVLRRARWNFEPRTPGPLLPP